ncbi:unnamed protein product [marine sediment metagenome]|uniref:Uncharacterized protein n=1 Tax=marine sediment metagenome TaxID=412755 RepID=X1KIE0_9ZZZZ
MEVHEKKILDLMSRERAHKWVFWRILEFCVAPKPRAEIGKMILKLPEMGASIFGPAVLMGWLEEAGGIEKVKEKWTATDAGKKVLELEAPEKKILDAVSEEPPYKEIFKRVLKFCESPRTKVEIVEMVEPLIPSERGSTSTTTGTYPCKSPKCCSRLRETRRSSAVNPTYFISKLEEVGGLRWVEKKWRTTEAGRKINQKGEFLG